MTQATGLNGGQLDRGTSGTMFCAGMMVSVTLSALISMQLIKIAFYPLADQMYRLIGTQNKALSVLFDRVSALEPNNEALKKCNAAFNECNANNVATKGLVQEALEMQAPCIEGWTECLSNLEACEKQKS